MVGIAKHGVIVVCVSALAACANNGGTALFPDLKNIRNPVQAQRHVLGHEPAQPAGYGRDQ